ncbi:histone H2B type F-M-like [Ochotona princeps]|uniref:histone H2B type F-M n=1 Tax=Ochotona princeps TaxID=9978 RepID=UPI002714B47F|nr:histone H2B type F-M [Ochotona princeps]XP_058515131.1 histone H2B type F-M-like [Ochotona princeps]
MAEPHGDSTSEETQEPASNPPREETPRRRHHRRRHHHRHQGHEHSFAGCFPRLLLRRHEDLTLSRAARSLLDSYVRELLERIAQEASCLLRDRNRSVLTHVEIQDAIQRLLSGELRLVSVFQGSNALLNYHRHK